MRMSTEASRLVEHAQTLPQNEQRELVLYMGANLGMFPDNDADKTKLWLALLGGLFTLALAALIGGVVLVMRAESGSGTAVFSIASAVVAGVIGLFSNPPTGSTGSAR